MMFRRKIFVKVLLLALIIALLGGIVMGLWNWIVPTLVVDAHAIDYPRAIGLLVLCRILFGGFRGHGGCHKARQWRHWQRMTQQEREQFRSGATPASRPNGETGL
jgi:NhaP-type Na+/H+ or K+/H+ antiporter